MVTTSGFRQKNDPICAEPCQQKVSQFTVAILYPHLRPLMANYVGDFTLQCPQIGELRVCSVIIFFFGPGEILESLRGAQPVHFSQIHSSKGE